MPPQDPQSDQDFLKANPKDQHAYLMATDPDYAKAPAPDQAAYLNHLAPQSQGEEHTLTSATDLGAEAFDKAHPILGKGVRMLSAAGGAAMGLPGAMYHAVTDPLTPEEEQDFKGHTRIPGEVGLERLTGARQMVNAGKDYASGKVSPGGAMSVLPEAIGQGIGTMGGAEAGSLATEGAMQLPGKQIVMTGGKMLAHTDLTKPFQAASRLPDFWRESSPAGRMLAETKRAVGERRASMIPTRVPQEASPRPIAPPSLQWNTRTPEPPAQVAPPPVRFRPEPQAVPSTPPPPVRYSAKPAAEPAPARSAAIPPVRYSVKPPVEAPIKQVAPPPVRYSTQPAAPPPRPAAIPPIRFSTQRPMAVPPSGAPPVEGITYAPEPRPAFLGENEGYMASVPRPDLNKMALSRKPGAATQLQQLGQPIIYIPSEADYPGPRR